MSNIDLAQFLKVAEGIASESSYDLNQTTMLMNMYIKSGNDIADYTIEQLRVDANNYAIWYQNLPTNIKQHKINPLLLFSTTNSSNTLTDDESDESEGKSDDESDDESEGEEDEDQDETDGELDESGYMDIISKIITIMFIYVNVYTFAYILHNYVKIELDYMFIFTYFIMTASLVQIFRLLDTVDHSQDDDDDNDNNDDNDDDDDNDNNDDNDDEDDDDEDQDNDDQDDQDDDEDQDNDDQDQDQDDDEDQDDEDQDEY